MLRQYFTFVDEAVGRTVGMLTKETKIRTFNCARGQAVLAVLANSDEISQFMTEKEIIIKG